MKVRVGDLKPNPFRDMKRYPIDQAKVETLMRSIRDTTFWDNLLARKTKDGDIELTAGHHRMLALRKELGLDAIVDIPVRTEKELPDALMLKIMANENMNEWENNAIIDQETVRAVVLAYAEDKIELEKPDPKTPGDRIRYAPLFTSSKDVDAAALEHPYTALTVGKFLGWMEKAGPGRELRPNRAVVQALTALGFIENDILNQDTFEGLSTTAAKSVIDETLKAQRSRELTAKIKEREAEEADKEIEKARADGDVEKRRMAERRAYKAREAAQEKREEGKQAARVVGQAVSKALKSGSVGYRNTDSVRADVEQKFTKKKQPPPWIDSVVGKVARYAYKTLGKDDPFCVHLGRLVQAKAYIGPISGRNLVTNLRDLSARASAWANKLEGYGSMYTDGGRPTNVVKLVARPIKALRAKNP